MEQKNEGSYTQRISIYLCGLKIPIRACSHMIPYNATPIFWWWLLKVLLKFLIDSTAPAVARSKASVCCKQRQKLLQYTFFLKNAYLSWVKVSVSYILLCLIYIFMFRFVIYKWINETPNVIIMSHDLNSIRSENRSCQLISY